MKLKDRIGWLLIGLAVFSLVKGGGIVPVDPVVDVDALRVLVVEETQDRSKLSGDQMAVITGKTVRDYVESRGGIFRAIDDDADVSLLAPEWQKMRAVVTTPSPSWAYYTPKGGATGPLAATEQEATAAIARYAP